MSNVVAAPIEATAELSRKEFERAYHHNLARHFSEGSLVIPEWNVRRYDRPSEDTIFPREYAFHLLGDIVGKTVIELGCGDGLSSVILALLGARVLSIDISDKELELTARRAAANNVGSRVALLYSDPAAIPVEAGTIDAVFCAAMLHRLDPIQVARQIRRILKPGGIAVFEEAVAGPAPFAAIKNSFRPYEQASHERPITFYDVEAVCRAVGVRGRRRKFWLAPRFAHRREARTLSTAAKVAQRFDAALLYRFPFIRKLASPLVWEARKES